MANDVLEYMNTAISLAAFLVSSDLKATVQDFRFYFEKYPSKLAAKFEAKKELEFVAQLIIDPTLLEELRGRVEGAIDDEVKCLRIAVKPQQMDACARKAERSVCNALNYIRERNEDELPTDFLKEKWRSYGCESI